MCLWQLFANIRGLAISLLQLLPLLLASLDCPQPQLLLTALEALLALLQEAAQAVVEHVPSLLSRLLELSRYPESMVSCTHTHTHIHTCTHTHARTHTHTHTHTHARTHARTHTHTHTHTAALTVLLQKVRIAALRCLGALTTLPYHVVWQQLLNLVCAITFPLPPSQVHPYRGMITEGLAASLDDHKRLVRKEAAEARSRWCVCGGTCLDDNHVATPLSYLSPRFLLGAL